MTSFPGSPRAQRGALVSIENGTARQRVVAFQYNPHTLTRNFELAGGGTGPEVGQLARPPVESLRVELELDAVDDLELGKPSSVAARLAALETLVSPTAASAVANTALAAAGAIEILPPDAPLILFVWGPSRVLPVQIRELSVTEEAHDPQLEPTRARVSLGLRVLSWADVGPTHPAYALSLSLQLAKEGLGQRMMTSSMASLSGNPN